MITDLIFHIKSLSRAIYYVTDEEDRFILDLSRELNEGRERAWVFNAAMGLRKMTEYLEDWSTRAHVINDKQRDIHEALIQVYRDDPKKHVNFYVFTDAEHYLKDPMVQRRVLNIIHQSNELKYVKILIFIGTRKFLPTNLARYFQVVVDKGLAAEEINSLVEDISTHLQLPAPPEPDKVFRGFTSFEIKSAISQSVVKTKVKGREGARIDANLITDFKRQQLQKTELVQYIDTSRFSFKDVGGVQRFKEWAVRTKACWTPEGRAFGLKPPKGVLCVGIWGCGKSLTTKAMGHAWQLPVVQLEMGRLRSNQVGESEGNAYRAIKIIESVAPCVTGETQVTLADGSSRSIEELWQDGSEDLNVMCWNERTLRVQTTKVRGITRRIAEAFKVTAANGFHLNATANHQHYVLRGGRPEWVRTDELQKGGMLAVPLMPQFIEKLGDSALDLKEVFEAECRWVAIKDIISIGTQTVFDLVCEGEDTHSFIANGLITHNCVVWMDEAEKSLAGSHSSSQSDAGTTSRVIGILSTWLQETDAPVCFAMTANSLATLPVEFVNRLDERFFFDLPSEEDRIDIFKIHLKKANQDPANYDLVDLSEKAKHMVGREIEQAIGAAMIESFHMKKPGLDQDILCDVLVRKPRIVKTMSEDIKLVRDWVGYDPETNDGIRARFAAPPDKGESGFNFVKDDGAK